MSKSYRSGGVGAMMDEYERAASDLVRIVSGLSDAEFERERDTRTTDPHCRSVQTITNHVIGSGYSYADYIRGAFSVQSGRPSLPVVARTQSLDQIKHMLAYTVETLEGRWEYSDEQVSAVRINSRWGVQYDMEQMLEHAIVHILRHRRQIERFLEKK
jgi:uncharacterized damage-inducible protein DinB